MFRKREVRLGSDDWRQSPRSCSIRIWIAGEYRDHHVAYSVGVTYAQLGERETAVTWLRQAAATGFPCLPWYSRDPLLAPLKGDPAFTAFLAELEARRDAASARFAHD